MNGNLIRPEYYDEDHILNEQEFKEFNFVRIDPYWKIRSSCYSLSLNCFGDKANLIRKIENLLFNNHLHKKPATDTCKDLASLDIELMVKNLKCSSGKFDSVRYEDLERYCNGEVDKKVPEEQVFKHQWPWHVVVELNKMQKNLSYQDIYKGLSFLMRPCMAFYNHFLEGECMTGIVVLPYTPKMLDYLNPLQIFYIVKALDMRIAYDIVNILDVLKQKLLDLYYLVEDSPKLHGILPCQTNIKPCHHLASMHCANHMCKICCQDGVNRAPCIIHDKYEEFFRHKLKSVYMFEENNQFDRSRTLRLHCRKLIRKNDLDKAFENVAIVWDDLKVYYHDSAHRIEYIYLVCQNQATAQEILNDQHLYSLKLEKYDVTISALSQSIYEISEQCANSETTLLIMRPLSTLEVVRELPNGDEYTKQITSIIQNVTQRFPNEFQIQEGINPVTGETDQQHILVKLPTKADVDRLYNAQPYLGCLIAHKLSHVQIFPFMRYHPNLCLTCSSFKEPSCIRDMCKDCCSRQDHGFSMCRCSVQVSQQNLAASKELLDSGLSKEDLCQNCSSKRDGNCKNNRCMTCCLVQAFRCECPTHDGSYYCKTMRFLDAYVLSRKMLQVVSESHVKVRYELKHGHYDWFRPVYGTNIQNEIIRVNKDLQNVVDNGSLVRSANNQKFKRDGKVFTQQANEPVTLWITRNEKIYESINHKGLPFLEYSYNEDPENPNTEHTVWVKNSANKYRTYANEDYEQYIKSPNLHIRTSFHFMLIGLDKVSFSIKELYQEIHNKFNTMVGTLSLNNIMILDNESLLTDIFNTPVFQNSKNLDENLKKMGRVACIKMDNVLDALCLLTKEVKVTLPLNNGTVDDPILYPSKFLIQYLNDYTPQTSVINIQTAGVSFSKMNKEIETLNYNIQTLEGDKHGDRGKGPKRGGFKGHGKNHPRPKDGKGPKPQKKFKR